MEFIVVTAIAAQLILSHECGAITPRDGAVAVTCLHIRRIPIVRPTFNRRLQNGRRPGRFMRQATIAVTQLLRCFAVHRVNLPIHRKRTIQPIGFPQAFNIPQRKKSKPFPQAPEEQIPSATSETPKESEGLQTRVAAQINAVRRVRR
jgi:hypothetical protein